MRDSDLLLGSIVVLVVALVFVVVAAAWKKVRPPDVENAPVPQKITFQSLADKSGTKVIHGNAFQPLDPTAEPRIAIDAYINGTFANVNITTAWSGLYVPGVPDGQNVSLEVDVSSLNVCGDIKPIRTGSKIFVGSFPVDASRGGPWPVIGLGAAKNSDGTYKNPFLSTAVAEGKPAQWSYGQQLARIALSISIPEPSCFRWCWTPMTISPSGQYLVPLADTSKWKTARIDLGLWASIMPGVTNTTDTLIVRTSAGCDITLRPGQYVSGINYPDLPATDCVIGAAAGLENSVFGFDLVRNTFGLVLVLS